MPSKRAMIFKDIAQLTTQIVSVRLLYTVIGIIGMIFIAQLGNQAVAAGALATALSTTFTVIGMSPLLMVGIVVSRSVGQGNTDTIGHYIRQAWLMGLCLGLLSAGALIFVANSLSYLGQPDEIIPLVKEYLYGSAWGTVPLYLIASCNQLFFPIKKGNLVIFWGLMTFLFILCLGTALTFGYVGFPRLGIGGWSYATSIVNWVVFALIVLYLYFHKDFKVYNLFNFKEKIQLSQMIDLLKLSLPITLQFSGELLAFSFLNLMVGWLGVSALSVQQIIIQCSTFALMFPMGGAQSSAMLIGQAVGRNEREIIKSIFYLSLLFVSLCMLVIAGVYIFLPKQIIGIYLTDSLSEQGIIELATIVLSITAFSQIVDAIRNVGIGALRGLHDVWMPMWMNMALLWLFALPSAYFLGFTLGYGVVGLNLGFLIAFLIGAILMTLRFRLINQKLILNLEPSS